MKKMRNQDRRIALRLPSEERARIQQLINEGKYENLSQVIRVALKDFLDQGWSNMPQQERSHNQIDILKWLKTQQNGATTAALKAYTRNEITQLGATDKTIENYIDTLKTAGFLEYKHPFWRITKSGMNFLERLGEWHSQYRELTENWLDIESSTNLTIYR